MKQCTVRYIRIYKIVLALVLPSFSIIPFIRLMHLYAPAGDWLQYFIILIFLACLISFSVWLVFMFNPKGILTVDENEIGICFGGTGWLQPDDFTVRISDITYISPYQVAGNDFVSIATEKPSRRFRLAARSYEIDESVEFNEAISEIRDKVDPAKG